MNLYSVRIITDEVLVITLEFPAMSTEEAQITAEYNWSKISPALYTSEIVDMKITLIQ